MKRNIPFKICLGIGFVAGWILGEFILKSDSMIRLIPQKEVRWMWFIFLIACIVVALAALLVILIGSVVVRYIVRKDREMERKFFEMNKENKE